MLAFHLGKGHTGLHDRAEMPVRWAMSEPTDLPPGTERGPSVAADDTEPASPPGRVAGFKDKSEELRERADETWKRVEAARSQKPFVDVAFETYERDRDHLGPLLSAAIAFRLFLVFVPFVALGMIVLGFFDFEASDLRNAGLVGLTAQSITASGNQPLWSQLLTLIVVVWAMLLAARSLVKALRLTHAVAWDLERRPLKDTTKTRPVGTCSRRARPDGDRCGASASTDLGRARAGRHDLCVRHLSGDVVGRVEDSATTRRDQLDHDAPGIGAVRPRRASVPACRRVLDRASDRQRSGSLRGARARDRPARRDLPDRAADGRRRLPERDVVVPGTKARGSGAATR